jgi:hypothetical protein
VLAPHWLRCSSSGLPGFPCDPWSLRDIAVPAAFRPRFILPWAPVRLQSMTEPARCSASPKRGAAPPMRFVGLSAPSAPWVRRHDECQPVAAFRPQVFATSRRLSPRGALRACFVSLARLGFPLQGFPFPGSRASSRRSLPSCRYPRRASSLRKRFAVGPASGSCSPWKSVARPSGYSPSGSSVPSWVFPSPGFSVLRPWLTFPCRLPSRASAEVVLDALANLLPRVFPNRSPGGSLARPADPHEVSGLFRSLTRSKARPDRAHVFAGSGMPRHRVTALASQGPYRASYRSRASVRVVFGLYSQIVGL